jgi:hypothetical protein
MNRCSGTFQPIFRYIQRVYSKQRVGNGFGPYELLRRPLTEMEKPYFQLSCQKHEHSALPRLIHYLTLPIVIRSSNMADLSIIFLCECNILWNSLQSCRFRLNPVAWRSCRNSVSIRLCNLRTAAPFSSRLSKPVSRPICILRELAISLLRRIFQQQTLNPFISRRDS